LVDGLTQEEFFSGVSRPRNPEIMRIFKDLEYVERLGSGVPYIVNKYGKEIFKLMSSVIRYAYLYDEVVKAEKDASITPQSHPDNALITPQSHPNHTSKLISAIQDNPSVTIGKLSKILGITIDAVKWEMRDFQRDGIIHRIGSSRKGYWEVIQNDVQLLTKKLSKNYLKTT
jgi:predicted HTH transcriptional regulator